MCETSKDLNSSGTTGPNKLFSQSPTGATLYFTVPFTRISQNVGPKTILLSQTNML
jgi:hypothetical protein